MARQIVSMEDVFSQKYKLTDLITNENLRNEAIGWLKGVAYLAPSWSSDSELIIKKLTDLTTFEAMNEPTDPEWYEAKHLYISPFSEVLEILKDAEGNGFTFKYENGKLFYREL